MKLVLLAAAGAVGTLSRYWLSDYIHRHAGSVFPWHTFAVNMIGCFLFGVVFAITEQRAGWDGNIRVIALTGFMGAFTTYSTFAFETAALLRESQYALAAGNIILQNALGVILLFLGLSAGKLLTA